MFTSFFIVMVLTMFLHWLFYDLLIRTKSKRFPSEWAKDGKPLGMFHTPPDALLFRGSISRYRLMWKWIFQTPAWITKDEKAEQFYKYFRLSGMIYFSLILFLVFSFIVIFLNQP
jgi:hypothetical protein